VPGGKTAPGSDTRHPAACSGWPGSACCWLSQGRPTRNPEGVKRLSRRATAKRQRSGGGSRRDGGKRALRVPPGMPVKEKTARVFAKGLGLL